MADNYRDRMMAATRIDRQAEREITRRIARLYEQAAEDMASKAAASRSGSLTERFAWELSQSLRERTRELWDQVGELTRSGMQTAADRAVGVQTSFLTDAGRLAGIDLNPTIRRVFAGTRDDAVGHILRGGVYGGNAPTLSKRIWNNAAMQSGQIEQVIAQAVAKGESPTKLAKALAAFVNPKAVEPSNWNDIYDIPFTYKVDYNAKRLSVTSIRHASWGATVSAARLNPYAQYFHWELTPAHVIFDICDAHAAHDEGMGEGNFSIDAAPLPHPFCTCLYYVDTDKSLEEIGRELRSWADGDRMDPLLEGAFGEWTGAKKQEVTPIEPSKEPAHYFNMGRINAQAVQGWEKARDDQIILTKERIKHIRKNHPGDLEKYGKHIPQVLRDPDFVLIDPRERHTSVWVRAMPEDASNIRITVRHATQADPPEIMNSILTFQHVRASEYQRLSRRIARTVYKRPE